MKKYLALLLFLFPAFFSLAQKPLTNSRTNSPYTYIYRLEDASTLLFLTGKQKEFKEEALKEPIFKYKNGDNVHPDLPQGNYLEVSAEQNQLHYNLIQKHSATFKQLQNSRDVRFILLDTADKEVKNAVAYSGKKLIAFDDAAQAYHTKQTKKDTLIKVVYEGVSNFFVIGEWPKQSYNYKKNTAKKSGLLAKLILPISKLFAPAGVIPARLRTVSNGFMVFNKPEYRPGDTVKFKAFVLQEKSKKPIKERRLAVRLNFYDNSKGKIIGYVNAYRDGGFEYQFKLVDTLGLRLDRDYGISLESLTEKTAKVSYNGSIDAKAKKTEPLVYLKGLFKYSDYELKSNSFKVRTDVATQSPGKPISMYFKATDENGLTVPDGRIKLIVTPGYGQQFGLNHVFIPDTLWKYQMPLDPVGETKLVLPDSIFPKVKMSFSVRISYLNSNNENREDYKSLEWDYHNKSIDAKIDKDTLKINYLVSGKSTANKGMLLGNDANNYTIWRKPITLPFKMAVSPNIQRYSVQIDSLKQDVGISMASATVNPRGYRTADSLFLQVDNPFKLKFWYTVFGGNRIIDEGSGTELYYKKPYKNAKSVSLLVNYIWSGSPQIQERTIPYQDKFLNIDIKQAETIYPGQQTEVEATVTDNKGKPVAGADITAYGVTSKFEHYASPPIPYLGKIYPGRRYTPRLMEKELENDGFLKLNWQYWAKNLGLDTIKYYQFTHPMNTFKIAEPTPDKVTQLAPFVVKNGEVQPVHLLYIDGLMVYFNQSQELSQYSFAVDTNVHYIYMRTRDFSIKVDSIKVPLGKKLILSVNTDTLQNKINRFTPLPDTLTTAETNLLDLYTLGVVPNFGFKLATLEQRGRIHLINYERNSYYRSTPIFVGPFINNTVDFNVKAGLSRSFIAEGGYSFELTPDLTKQKSLPYKQHAFSRALAPLTAINPYNQYALSAAGVDTVWQNYLDIRARQISTQNYGYYGQGGRLTIKAGNLANGSKPFVKCVLIFKYDDSDYLRITNGDAGLYNLDATKYRILYLFKGNNYYLQDNVNVKLGGLNYYNTGTITPHAADSMSVRLGSIINDRILGEGEKINNERLRETFNDCYLDMSQFKKELTGTVKDLDNRKPQAGMLVKLVGTTHQTITDANGVFKLMVPARGTLRLANDKYVPEEISITGDKEVTVYMRTKAMAALEVMIRGYVRRSREQTTGSSTIITAKEIQDVPVANVEQLLQGKVAGMNIQNNTGAPGQRGLVNIRGLSTVGSTGAGGNPLYVVDGVVMTGNPLVDIKQEDIASMEVLKEENAMALYGARAANGVILIMTVRARDKMLASEGGKGSFRHNFSDYAYWQPKLTTDANGKIKFAVTYPDDITSWRTFMIGITDQRQTGLTEGLVKAYKPVSATFNSPLFAVRGDSFSPLGKLMNYTTDTVKVKRKFSYNGVVLSDRDLTVENSRIDTFKVIADGKDSLKFEYSLKRANGYFDGEQRAIPVFEQGSLETKGTFGALEKDTTVNLSFDPNLSEVTLRAEASILPVLLDETEHLRDYEYLCNEQLASKLKALLIERELKKYLKQPFTGEDAIKDIIKKLMDSRRAEGTWGWWKDTPEEMWISLHVVEALLSAEASGIATPLNKQGLIDYLLYQATSYKGQDKLRVIQLLKKLNSKADLKALVTDYEKALADQQQKALPAIIKQNDGEKYQLMLTHQIAGMPVEIDSLLKNMRRTMFGNVYWGETSYNFFNNSIPLSLTAYQIIRNEGKHPDLLAKLRNYFMEQRGGGNWRNTYESALIMETILPDIAMNGETFKPSTIALSGDKTETVKTFPYEIKLSANAKITVKKEGSLPVYLTTYQKFWNPAPKKVSTDFRVDTWFAKGQTKITKVKGGEAITLIAEVTARADADFVMVEIPIPAGCSYDGKPQGYYGSEAHREYFKNKVSIFCRSLSAGKHVFTVRLMPRYSGNYHINPAKAEMMYFPVFYGREGMKMFEIE